MGSLLNFDTMITPKIITIIYWLLLVSVVIGGLGSMFSPHGFSFGGLLMGLFFMVLGGLGARVWCELLIVLFKINENIHKIANK